MSTRCDLTDLLVDQCAHCQGHTLDAPVLCRAGWPFDARWPGRCEICLDPFDTGDRITKVREYNGDPVDGYAHAECPRRGR